MTGTNNVLGLQCVGKERKVLRFNMQLKSSLYQLSLTQIEQKAKNKEDKTDEVIKSRNGPKIC